MTFNFKTGNVSVYPNGEVALLLNLPREYQKDVNEINKMIESDKLKTIELKQFREKRSLTANGYMFALLEQISQKTGMSLGDCYVKAIQDYGVSVEKSFMTKEAYAVFEPYYSKIATKINHSSTMSVVTREYTKGQTDWVEYVAFIGSSEYDSKQFSHLLDGVIKDATDLGIQTMTPNEIAELMAKWEVK